VFAALIAVVVVLFEISLLTAIPWAGFELDNKSGAVTQGVAVTAADIPGLQGGLRAGDYVTAIKSDNHPYLPLAPKDLIADPEQLGSFTEFTQVYKTNAALYERLTDSGQLTLKMEGGEEIRLAVLPHRSWLSLPLNFWVSNAAGFVGLCFSVFIWAYRGYQISHRLLALIGIFFAFGSSAFAVYGSRSLALPPDLFYGLSVVTYLAKSLVAYSLLAIILIYPHQLLSKKIVPVCLLIPVLNVLNMHFQWLELPFNTFYFSLFIAFISGIPFLVWHWHLSRNHPVNRAALVWMMIPIYITAGSEIILFMVPTLSGQTSGLPIWMPQVLFLPLYIGFILGVLRVRLFDVERWWLLSWQWFLGGLLIISVDLLLVSVLHLHALGALSITLILAAWLYFPLRQWLWGRLGHFPEPHLENHIHDFIQAFVGGKKTDIKERWRTLLQRIFTASSAEISGGNLSSAQISEDGMVLLIPGINDHYHINLYGKYDSSRLFSRQDIRLSQTLSELAAYTTSLQRAKEQGQKDERNRIMRDLHDDVGANLVSMIYRAQSGDEAQLAKDTLTLLRETIYTLDDHSCTRLTLAIAKWRQEIQQRCRSAGVRLRWDTAENIPGTHEVDARQQVNLGRVLRESLTNALKHAHPGYFDVHFQVRDYWLHIRIMHNGDIKPPESWTEGKGVPGIRTRIQELHGKVRWQFIKSTGSLETYIAVPLNRERTHDRTT
jgi:signal transduction histidine kinase